MMEEYDLSLFLNHYDTDPSYRHAKYLQRGTGEGQLDWNSIGGN